jgi:hypothetical protein
MRPEHADQAFGQLRELIVELMAQPAHQERKAFEQTLHVRIAFCEPIEAKRAGTIRESAGEFFATFTQVAHFRFVVAQDVVVFDGRGHKQ